MRSLYTSMRPHIFFVIVFFCTAALVAHVVTRTQGPHNGVIKKADNYFIEMKTVEKKFFAYLLDKKLRSIGNKDMTASADFLFPDSTVMNIALRPEESDGFTCEVPSDFYTCRINFNRQGKIVSAKFSSPIKVVKK